MVENYFRTPLQVMRAIHHYDDLALSVYMLSPTGGVVQGDEYLINLTAEADTHALVTTQAATKVYRMPERGATQCVNIEVGTNAVVEYLPDAVILFGGADLTQETHVTLKPGALFMMQEIVMPGRLARGEVLNFKRYKNRVVVRDTRGLLLYDSADYVPQPEDAARLGVLDGAGPCWGSWYLLGDFAAWDASPAAFCAAHHEAINSWPDALGGLSVLHRDGLTARVVARTLAPIYAVFSMLWQSARSEIMRRPAGVIRK